VATPEAAALQQALAVAVKAPVPTLQLSLPGEDLQPSPTPLCARVAGFSVHAAQAIVAEDRLGLERLCRYGLRPPFAQEPLVLRDDGRLVVVGAFDTAGGRTVRNVARWDGELWSGFGGGSRVKTAQ